MVFLQFLAYYLILLDLQLIDFPRACTISRETPSRFPRLLLPGKLLPDFHASPAPHDPFIAACEAKAFNDTACLYATLTIPDRGFSTGALGPSWGPRSGFPGDTSRRLY